MWRGKVINHAFLLHVRPPCALCLLSEDPAGYMMLLRARVLGRAATVSLRLFSQHCCSADPLVILAPCGKPINMHCCCAVKSAWKWQLGVGPDQWPGTRSVVQFKEVFLTPEYLAIAMEYAAGGDMFQYVKQRGGLEEAEARWFFQQLIIGMDYCHKMVRRRARFEAAAAANIKRRTPAVVE